MTDKRHEEIMELIPAYVLGAVPPDEAPLIRAHILSCDECVAEADRFAETASSLALSVESAPLSPGFADRVMAAATDAGSESTATAAPAPAPAKSPRFTLRWSLVPGAAFLALILAVVAVSAMLYQTNQTLQRQRTAI
ncbi:MAG: zf-HC2 domain-containing protein, partial [Actinobacteria bacterium]|nr:zf-HC2 domain-containing protein [Actinomycetota bacterium]